MDANHLFDRKSGNALTLRAVVIDRDRSEVSRTSQILQATGCVEVVSETASFSITLSIIERHHPDYVFITACDESIPVIKEIRQKFASVVIVALAVEENGDLVLRSFRAGADELLVKPLSEEELHDVFERLNERHPTPEPAPEQTIQGRVLAFWGSRGGCGTTTLALNTAHLLSQSQPTVLVDLHFGQGDLPAHIDIQPQFSIRDITESVEGFDQTLIDSVAVEHESGLRLLLQPDDDQPFFLREESIQQLVLALRQKYAFVVLDLGCDMETASAIAPYTDDFLLVLSQEIPSVYLAVRKIQRLSETGCDMNRLYTVVNAYSKSSTVTLSRIAKALGKRKMMTVREDSKNVLAAINQGILLSKITHRGKAVKDIARLSQVVLDREPIPVVEEESEETIQLTPFRNAALAQG